MIQFFKIEDHGWEYISSGIKRNIVGYTDELMAVHLCFDKGAIGAPHTHDIHDKTGYVVSGSFEAEIEGEKHVLTAGDAYIATKHMVHGAVAFEQDSILLDMFSPAR